MALKILLLTHKFYPSIGGIETITQLLAQAFSEAGHEVHVVTWSTDPTNKYFSYTVVRNPNVKHLFREHAWADIVLENNICLRLSWPSIMYFRPSFIVLQTWLPEGSEGIQITKRVKSYWLRRATQVIAISDAVRNRDWPAATVIGNSYDAKTFRIIPVISRNLDFVFVGRGGTGQQHWVSMWESAGLGIELYGEQSPESISTILSSSSIGISTTPIALIEKSGSVAAMREHGLPVICVRERWKARGIMCITPLEGVAEYKLGNLKELLCTEKSVATNSVLSTVGTKFIADLHISPG